MAEYIERQAAIEAIVNCTNCGTPDELRKYVDKHSLENGWTGGVLDAMEAVEDMPAADVAPVVHGYWIVHENADVFEGYEVPMFECSKCRAWKEDDSDFCPDCGADMRGEQDDR